MNKARKIILVLLMLVWSSTGLFAQCSVCRAGAESNVEHGYSAGRGLNSGIIYLLCTPYILGGVGFYIWYNQKKKNRIKQHSDQSGAD